MMKKKKGRIEEMKKVKVVFLTLGTAGTVVFTNFH